MRVSDGNDNDDGGDDNYPKVVMEMGRWDERKDMAGTGKNSWLFWRICGSHWH